MFQVFYIKLSCSQCHHPIKFFMFWYKIVFTGPIFQFAFGKIVTIINIIKERLLTTNQIMKSFCWPHMQTHTQTHRRFLFWTRECPPCTQATEKIVILLPPQGEMSNQCHCFSINIWLFCLPLVLTPSSGNSSYLPPVCHILSALPAFCRYLCSMFLLFTIQRAVETRYQIYTFVFYVIFLIPSHLKQCLAQN